MLYEQAAAEHGVVLDRSIFEGTAQQSWIDDAWAEWHTPLGVDHSAASTDAVTYRDLRIALHRQRFTAAGVEESMVEPIARRLTELESDPHHFILFEDTQPVLATLNKRGVRSFIVSNHIWELPTIASNLGLDPLIETVITSARVGYRKPHPAIYTAALQIADIPASEALFVGDSWSHDVEGPRSVGIDALLIDRDGTSGHPGSLTSLLELPFLDGMETNPA